MKQNFIDAKDKYVGKYVVFAKTADNTLWADANFSVELVKEEVVHAFEIGAILINAGTKLLVPVDCTVATGTMSTVDVVSEIVTVVSWTLGTKE